MKAFVTFTTEGYTELLEVAVKSVGAFSKHPIVVYGINCDVKLSEEYDYVIKRRIDAQYNGGEIFYQKFNILIQILLNEKFDEIVYIDSDVVVNYNIDELFDKCKDINEFPLCSIHPDDVMNQQVLVDDLDIKERTQHYVHAAYMIINKSCLPFLQECYYISTKLTRHAPNWDESLLNVMMWKYRLTDNYTDVYDPYFEIYKTFLGIEDVISIHGYDDVIENYGKNVYFHMFHGCKDAKLANEILQKLIINYKENVL